MLQGFPTSLDAGPIKKECACTDDDSSCDERVRYPAYYSEVQYGVPRTYAAGACRTLSMQPEGTHSGTVAERNDDSSKCDLVDKTGNPNKPNNNQEICASKILTGADQV